MKLQPGTTLADYRILSLLGSGGMGEVYRAQDTKLGREVALKVLREEVSEDKERLARFEREAKTLAALNHNNIATLHAFEKVGDTHFLVMELVPGEDLSDRLKRGPFRSTTPSRSSSRSPPASMPHTSAAFCIATSSLRT